MTPEELLMVKEGLALAETALQQLQKVDNSTVKHVANLLHSALTFGEMFLGMQA